MQAIKIIFITHLLIFESTNSQRPVQLDPLSIFSGHQQNSQNFQQNSQNNQQKPQNSQQDFNWPDRTNSQTFDYRQQNLPQFSGPIENRRISVRKCNEYIEKSKNSYLVGSLSLIPNFQDIKTDQCDISQGLIIGGTNAKPGEFPHMVAIGYPSAHGSVYVSFRCGGSLISERFVLTAAHCRSSDRQKPTMVRLGVTNLGREVSTLPENDVAIESFIDHEYFDLKKSKNDIAVVKLAKIVTFSKNIRPACLMSDVLVKTEATATGWGLTEALSDNISDILQKVKLSILPIDECTKNFEDNDIDDRQLCAGEKEGGKDTCQGDAGGPLQIVSDKNKCVYVIVGISSYGSTFCGAADSPGVYTNVSAYIDWIEQKVWGST